MWTETTYLQEVIEVDRVSSDFLQEKPLMWRSR